METTLGVIAIVAFFLVVFLAYRLAEMSGTMRSNKADLAETQQKLKKVQSKLEGRSEKLSKKGHEASKRQSKVKGQQQRIDQQQQHLNDARTQLSQAQGTVQDLSKELNRVRIDREQLRLELTASKKGAKSGSRGTPPAPPVATETREQAAPVAAQEPQGEKAQTTARLGRDLEIAHEAVDRLQGRVRSLKEAVVEREYNLRKMTRRNEHNHRAYIITQLQLDLVSDEIYVLTHDGEQPPLRMADKAIKRNIDLDPTEVVTLLNEDGPIDLIGVGARSDEPFEPEAYALPKGITRPAPPEKEAAPEEPIAQQAAEETPEPEAVEAAAEVEAETEPAKKKTTRLRKGGRAKKQAATPPRPEA